MIFPCRRSCSCLVVGRKKGQQLISHTLRQRLVVADTGFIGYPQIDCISVQQKNSIRLFHRFPVGKIVKVQRKDPIHCGGLQRDALLRIHATLRHIQIEVGTVVALHYRVAELFLIDIGASGKHELFPGALSLHAIAIPQVTLAATEQRKNPENTHDDHRNTF